MSGQLYLLHFTTPLKHARHYLGWATDVPARLKTHARGQGARLVEVLEELGIGWELAARAGGTRLMERKLKLSKNVPRICPVCQGDRGHAWRDAIRNARAHPAPRDWWRTNGRAA